LHYEASFCSWKWSSLRRRPKEDQSPGVLTLLQMPFFQNFTLVVHSFQYSTIGIKEYIIDASNVMFMPSSVTFIAPAKPMVKCHDNLIENRDGAGRPPVALHRLAIFIFPN
jgi:hypothetical protein